MSPEELDRQLTWHREQIEELERQRHQEQALAAERHEEDDSFELQRQASVAISSPSPILFSASGDRQKKKRPSVLLQWPRLGSCLLGVVLPLLGLVGLCMAFGLWVARYEAPYEIRANDAKLQARANAEKQVQVVQVGTTLTPKACLEAFLLNKTDYQAANDHLLHVLIATLHNQSRTDLEEQVQQVILQQDNNNHNHNNTTSTTLLLQNLHQWMNACGSVVDDEAIRILNEITHDFQTMGELTFDWIRCVPGANGLGNGFSRTAGADIPALLHQSTFYANAWTKDQKALQLQHAQESMQQHGTPQHKALSDGWYTSIAEATGGHVCELNPAAAGWFWFTILSTMGYGNQGLMTAQGRAMVYTLGFVSMLLFGFILGMAGLIASAIADDLLVNLNLPLLTTPWACCLLWGCAYYAWMALTAVVVMVWKHQRLQDTTFSFEQGYWFAYISSTTVGLGDVVLEPLVLQSSDMIVFPFLFLVNFVFIAAFLSKLGELAQSLFRGHFVEKLVQQMEKTNAFRQKQMALKGGMMGRACRRLQVEEESQPKQQYTTMNVRPIVSSLDLTTAQRLREASVTPTPPSSSIVRDDVSC